jgi:hypothetical protein
MLHCSFKFSFNLYTMKKLLLFVIFLFSKLLATSQSLGGYPLYGCLSTASISPGCSVADYVTGWPDDSIWVNVNTNSVMTGMFTCWSMDHPGNDVMLETGYNTMMCQVKLLLKSGAVSDSVHLDVSNWYQLDTRTWKNLFTDCSTNAVSQPRYLTTIDYVAHFHIQPTDTVVGITIKFYYTPGAPDFAGAYIISNIVGIDEKEAGQAVKVYPNPFTDILKIESGNVKMTEVSLYDIAGKETLRKNINSGEINTEGIASGIYIYEIRNGEEPVSRGKVVKE